MTTHDRIRELIATELQYNGPRSSLTDDYPLIENQVIDSLDMLKLVSLLEEQFDVDVDDEDLVPDNFGTVGDIARFVDSKRAA